MAGTSPAMTERGVFCEAVDRAVLDAFDRYGKGQGHPAQLNGDWIGDGVKRPVTAR